MADSTVSDKIGSLIVGGVVLVGIVGLMSMAGLCDSDDPEYSYSDSPAHYPSDYSYPTQGDIWEDQYYEGLERELRDQRELDIWLECVRLNDGYEC